MKRRKFINQASIAGLSFSGFHLLNSCETEIKNNNQTYMGGFKATPIREIKAAFVGVGDRGRIHARNFNSFQGTKIVGVSDLYEARVKETISSLNSEESIKGYWGKDNLWIEMIKETKPDVVFVSTNWDNHAPMAIKSMELGSHAFVEVPLANTIEDLWGIVNTSEKTRKHCMMLENVNYGREELMFLNICRKGLIGELIHGEASYIHDLRGQMFQKDGTSFDGHPGTGSWRTKQYSKNIGNLYPTHGLGPVAQYMSLARKEDNFNKIVSLSSPSKGRYLMAKKYFDKNHEWNNLEFKNGDINTSIIQTTYGKTIMIQWDETSPRPYTRHNLIQGTMGALTGFPTRVFFDSKENQNSIGYFPWIEGKHLSEIYEKYDHPLYKKLNEKTADSGHGGMDGIMMYRVIECLQKGEPLDQNVYEGAFWSAVTPLSAKSIDSGGNPQNFPDFTRGKWKDTEPLGIVL